MAVLSTNCVCSSVPLAEEASATPPVGTDIVVTSTLELALPNASRTLSLKVYDTPGDSAPGSRPSAVVSSDVPTRFGSLKFSAAAGTTLHSSTRLDAGADELTAAESVIWAAGFTRFALGDTMMAPTTGRTTPGDNGAFAANAGRCVSSTLEAFTAKPAPCSAEVSAVVSDSTAPMVVTSALALPLVSVSTAKATFTPAASRRRPVAPPPNV